MTIHIGAEAGQIAETVLMPGDPIARQMGGRAVFV
jgi:purine-nucleoside phosphorylase